MVCHVFLCISYLLIAIQRPQNAELFNLQHSEAQDVIEQIFGVVK
jgi:hypothetical protein